MSTQEEHQAALASWAAEEPHEVALHMDKAMAAAMVANLQLALRHPANKGEAADVARSIIDGFIADVAQTHPAAAAAMRLGDASMADVPLTNPPGA